MFVFLFKKKTTRSLTSLQTLINRALYQQSLKVWSEGAAFHPSVASPSGNLQGGGSSGVIQHDPNVELDS